MKKVIISMFSMALLAMATSLKVNAAVLNPKVTGTTVNPSPISNAATPVNVSLVVANSGDATADPNIELIISLSLLKPNASFNIATDIIGRGAALLTWTYDAPSTTFTGVLSSTLPHLGGGSIVIGNLYPTTASLPSAEATALV